MKEDHLRKIHRIESIRRKAKTKSKNYLKTIRIELKTKNIVIESLFKVNSVAINSITLKTN